MEDNNEQTNNSNAPLYIGLVVIVALVGSFFGGKAYEAHKDKNLVIIAETIGSTFDEMENVSHYESYNGDHMIKRFPWGEIHNGKIRYIELHFIGPDEMETRLEKVLKLAKQRKDEGK